MDLLTQASSPQRWVGPSVLLSTTKDSRAFLGACGWFASLLRWENRFPGPPVDIQAGALRFAVVGESAMFTDPHDYDQAWFQPFTATAV
jgi:hypothetical protein